MIKETNVMKEWSALIKINTSEPPHDKTNKMICAPSEDSLSTWRNIGLLTTYCAHRLIQVFAGPTCHFVGFVMRWLIWLLFLSSFFLYFYTNIPHCLRASLFCLFTFWSRWLTSTQTLAVTKLRCCRHHFRLWKGFPEYILVKIKIYKWAS